MIAAVFGSTDPAKLASLITDYEIRLRGPVGRIDFVSCGDAYFALVYCDV